MSIVVPPYPDAPNWERSSDEVDDLLHTFFRSQMPDPWPELQLPAPGQRLRPQPRAWSSRAALAAALAFLLLGGLALSAGFRGNDSTSSASSGLLTATHDPLGLNKQLPDNQVHDTPAANAR